MICCKSSVRIFFGDSPPRVIEIVTQRLLVYNAPVEGFEIDKSAAVDGTGNSERQMRK